MVVGLAVAGFFIYLAINLTVALLVLAGMSSTSNPAVLGVAAGFLALLSLGGGLGLILIRKPWSKGLGMGLMIGWALTSIVTAGFCTGLNPTLYTG